MRVLIFFLVNVLAMSSSCQELDIFQADSIYANCQVIERTMYSIMSTGKQKELVTCYNSRGQKVKQYWYWNGDEHFHNMETFNYSDSGLLQSLVDSFVNGEVQITKYYYKYKVLAWQVELNTQNDTCDFRSYPLKYLTVHRWYMNGQSYRVDTSIFEKENVQLRFYGYDQLDKHKWNYIFENQFDNNGNLIRVLSKGEKSYTSFTWYSYSNNNLLTTKEEQVEMNGKMSSKGLSFFTYAYRSVPKVQQ